MFYISDDRTHQRKDKIYRDCMLGGGKEEMIYTVIRIDEADYGCEEREAGAPTQALLTLVDEKSVQSRQQVEDALLYQREINEGDRIYFDADGNPAKAADRDWTKNCSSKNVDLAAFVNKMEAVKAGRKVEWKCPFCGGNVGMIEREGGRTVIGCDSCDMRIRMENH